MRELKLTTMATAFTPPSDPVSDHLERRQVNFKRSFSAFKRIKTYLQSRGMTRLSALASIAIEKVLLIELKQDAQLHEVIERFL